MKSVLRFLIGVPLALYVDYQMGYLHLKREVKFIVYGLALIAAGVMGATLF